MADSNITKRALAAALKELMAEIPFAKISVSDICEKCEMNRKSFYYHFKDKFELVNWIYDTEFIALLPQKDINSGWDFLMELCNYLYSNRSFYRKAMRITGQNSFSEHFREMLFPLITEYLRALLIDQEVKEFHVHFFADGFVCAIERWIQDRNAVEPEEFIALLKSCIESAAIKVYRDMNIDAQ